MSLLESLVGNIGIGINQDLVKVTQWALDLGYIPKSIDFDDGAARYEFDAKNTKYRYSEAYNEAVGFLQTLADRVYVNSHNIDNNTRVTIIETKNTPFTIELIGTMRSKPNLTIVTYDDKSRVYLDKVFEKVK